MSTSRATSQHQFGRKRSNTAQSILRPAPAPPAAPLQVGDTKIFTVWVHDPKDDPHVIINHAAWPGILPGDVLHITNYNPEAFTGFFCRVRPDDGVQKPQLQISVPKPVAETFGLRNNSEILARKVDEREHEADFVELTFQDQYLGRPEMWHLAEHLAGQCVYAGMLIQFLGSSTATISAIYRKGVQIQAAVITTTTKAIYRSLSAKVTIFIQVCRELWEFSDDGERYNEKIVHSFLPALISKWREAGTNHIITIVLISRVFYDESEIGFAAGPLRQDDDGRWYKDFMKVVTDLQAIYEWKPTLVSLKDSFWDFQRDILLTHHYHRSALEPSAYGPPEQVRLVGRLSDAHDGPILEAMNLGLNPSETHYIDRSLCLTGASTILITPGTGYFRVNKHLLRFTTTRVLDQGFGLDLISLAKPPLHLSPIFSFKGVEPDLKDREVHRSTRARDPLWGGDDSPADAAGRDKTVFWWEPFWISVSFWDKQMDLPFREDRFIAQAKMHEIQMLGLLEHDVLASIEVPFLPEHGDPTSTPRESTGQHALTKEEADKFDMDVFAVPVEREKPPMLARSSYGSVGSGSKLVSSYRSPASKGPLASHRNSLASVRAAPIGPIEESPRRILRDLPDDGLANAEKTPPAINTDLLSTSPSQMSIMSRKSNQSGHSGKSNLSGNTISSATEGRKRDTSSSRGSITAKLAPSWLFNPFRSVPSQPQTSVVSASGVASPGKTATNKNGDGVQSALGLAQSPKPKPVTIRQAASSRANAARGFDDDPHSLTPHRNSFPRHSPLNVSPMKDPHFGKRNSVVLSSTLTSNSTMTAIPSSHLPSRAKPLKLTAGVSSVQSSLASRWQHMFPRKLYKREMKWQSLVTPGCLPLTVDYFPTTGELETSYDVVSYHFFVDPPEMKSFFIKPPVVKGHGEQRRRAWALVVMRQMACVRLTQGFQFVLRPETLDGRDTHMDGPTSASMGEEKNTFRIRRSYLEDNNETPKPRGAAEVLRSVDEPVYLSMSNEIHSISYKNEYIEVKRYLRRMPPYQPYEYQCLIWPKLGVGYTEWATAFTTQAMEAYGWNRLDMLIAGYEKDFNESLRYWRTRFVVIPTIEPPPMMMTGSGSSGERLNEEEVRILGIDKLAEMFSKVRWQSLEDKNAASPSIRFLPTTLSPVMSVMDDSLMAKLEEIHATGPLRKKPNSQRELASTPLATIAKLMREDDGVPIKSQHWHSTVYPDSFTGFDFVSWLVREFWDVSTRANATEWGVKLQQLGLFEHCRGHHGFLDGHYFYRLKGEYAVSSTPRTWFRSRHGTDIHRGNNSSPRRSKKRLILSQSMVIDIDPNKRSDRAEPVILHHDIIHNPANVFHFELQWIGTTARLIEDQLRQWGRAIEEYGLTLVEAYVTEISDVRERNAFQSCFPIRLAVPPPRVSDLGELLPAGTEGAEANYFEYALLRQFNFIIDIEAGDLYPEQIDVVYSYRRVPFTYTQFVHRTGVAFVQVLENNKGFLFLTNRLVAPGRLGTATKDKGEMAEMAERIRSELNEFCQNAEKLKAFYEKQLAKLGPVPEEPPELSI